MQLAVISIRLIVVGDIVDAADHTKSCLGACSRKMGRIPKTDLFKSLFAGTL